MGPPSAWAGFASKADRYRPGGGTRLAWSSISGNRSRSRSSASSEAPYLPDGETPLSMTLVAHTAGRPGELTHAIRNVDRDRARPAGPEHRNPRSRGPVGETAVPQPAAAAVLRARRAARGDRPLWGHRFRDGSHRRDRVAHGTGPATRPCARVGRVGRAAARRRRRGHRPDRRAPPPTLCTVANRGAGRRRWPTPPPGAEPVPAHST